MTDPTDPTIPTVHRRSITTPVGVLTIEVTDEGIRAVTWPADAAGDRVPAADDVVEDDHPLLDEAAAQLTEYFAGERTEFELRLDPRGTEFQRAAWDALRTIPFGETLSYGEQAERMGARGKARAVGAANGKNPISVIVPCHRVVGADGSLTGFAGGLDAKTWLLDHERRVAGHTLV
jgi:methylated-DNA-[protein]-cysteine S-methyltransferase